MWLRRESVVAGCGRPRYTAVGCAACALKPVGTMKLVIAVVQNEDADAIVEALLERQFRATRLASTGGFLRRGNTTLLIGVEDHEVDTVLAIVRERAKTRIRQESPQGAVQGAAATVFVIPLEDYQRL